MPPPPVPVKPPPAVAAGGGFGSSFSLTPAEYQAANEAATLESPRVSAARRKQQQQSAAYAQTFLVARVVEAEARGLAEETIAYFDSLVDGSKTSHPKWLEELAACNNGKPSVLHLCVVRWRKVVTEGHARRQAYAAKRSSQRDAVLSTLGMEQGLGGLSIGGGAARPIAPPSGWGDSNGVGWPTNTSVHSMLRQQQRRLSSGVPTSADAENVPPPPDAVDAASAAPASATINPRGPNSLLGGATAVVTGLRRLLSAGDPPSAPAVAPTLQWPALPSWFTPVAQEAELPQEAPAAAAMEEDDAEKEPELNEEAVQYVLAAEGTKVPFEKQAFGSSASLKRLHQQLDHLAAAQASTYQGLGYVRAGRPWTAPVEAPATEEPQQEEGGPPMSAAARLMYELKKAKEEARRVEERLVRLRR